MDHFNKADKAREDRALELRRAPSADDPNTSLEDNLKPDSSETLDESCDKFPEENDAPPVSDGQTALAEMPAVQVEVNQADDPLGEQQEQVGADVAPPDLSQADDQPEVVEADEVQEVKPETAEDRIVRRAMENIRPLIRYLGALYYYPFTSLDFVPHDYDGLGPRPPILFEKATGWWEEDCDGGVYGCDPISLVEHVRGVPKEVAIDVLTTFLDTLPSNVGWERIPEFELCNYDGCKLVVAVPRTTRPPAHWGHMDENPEDLPLRARSGRLLGYTRRVIFDRRFDSISGFPVMRTFPLTCWQRRDGAYGWKNQYLKPPYNLFGVEQLSLNRNAPVVLTDDEFSTDFARALFPPRHGEVLGVAFITAPNSFEKTDLSPLAGRTVFIQLTAVGDPETVREKLWAIDPRTKVGIIRISLDANFSPYRPLAEGELVRFPETPGQAFGWRLQEYEWAASNNGWKLDVKIDAPVSLGSEIAFDDFEFRDSGIWHVKRSDKGDDWSFVASRIDVVARARTASQSGWGICLEFNDHDSVSHQWCVPMSLLGNTEYCNTLLDLGAYVSPFHRQKLTELLLTYDPGHRARAVTKPGWEKNQFIFPDGSHVGHATELISYQTADPTNRAFTQRGTLDEWKENVAAYCANNSRLVLGIGTALTGPVLSLLGEESGGFHFPGESSTGKTTALHPACSVWGKPESFLTRWRATDNGLEANATQRNDTMIALDEMSQVSPEDAGKIVYMLANGQGKARATQDATAKAISSWRLMILSTGEVGLEQHMAGAGLKVMAGQQTRLIDIPANAGAGHGVFENIHGSANGSEFSLFLKRQTANYHGVAGRAWVNALADPELRPALLQQIKDYIREFEGRVPPEADGQVRRVARRFILVAAVAEACADLDILPWEQGHATTMISRCFSQWVDHRGGLGNLESDQALSRLRRFLAEHGDSGFTPLSAEGIESATDRVTIRRLGFRGVGPDGHTDYFILPAIFREVICAGLDPKQVIRHLKNANALVLDPNGKPQVMKRLPELGSLRVYHVRSTVLAEPGGADTPPVSQIKMG